MASIGWFCRSVTCFAVILGWWLRKPCHDNNYLMFRPLNYLSSSFWCSIWTSAGHLDCIYMRNYNNLLPCDWLDIWVNECSNRERIYSLSFNGFPSYGSWTLLESWKESLALYVWRTESKAWHLQLMSQTVLLLIFASAVSLQETLCTVSGRSKTKMVFTLNLVPWI